jgi:hypothetical protein
MALKQIQEINGTLYHALSQFWRAMEQVTVALDAVQTAFEHTANVGVASVNPTLESLLSANAQMICAFKETTFRSAKQRYQEECVLRVQLFDEDLRRLEAMRQERKKAKDVYDYHRNELEHKEADYAKKGKELSQSKNHQALVLKAEEARTKFEAISGEFKLHMRDGAIAKKDLVLAGCTQCFAEHMSAVFGSLYMLSYATLKACGVPPRASNAGAGRNASPSASVPQSPVNRQRSATMAS